MNPHLLSLSPVTSGPTPKPPLKITSTASPAPKVMEAAANCHIEAPTHIWSPEEASDMPSEKAVIEARAFLSSLNHEGLDAHLNEWVNGLR